jgi:hypothetical protein
MREFDVFITREQADRLAASVLCVVRPTSTNVLEGSGRVYDAWLKRRTLRCWGWTTHDQPTFWGRRREFRHATQEERSLILSSLVAHRLSS